MRLTIEIRLSETSDILKLSQFVGFIDADNCIQEPSTLTSRDLNGSCIIVMSNPKGGASTLFYTSRCLVNFAQVCKFVSVNQLPLYVEKSYIPQYNLKARFRRYRKKINIEIILPILYRSQES
jgi:hypothetical protein